MLSLTKKADYGLVALAFLGKRRRAGDGPVSARVIAETFQLPTALLMNIMKELQHAQLVDSVRGKNGGYELALDPERVSLAEVFTALDGPLRFAACAQELPIIDATPQKPDTPCGCPIEGECLIREPILALHHKLQAFFDGTTLADLLPESGRHAGRVPMMPSIENRAANDKSKHTSTALA